MSIASRKDVLECRLFLSSHRSDKTRSFPLRIAAKAEIVRLSNDETNKVAFMVFGEFFLLRKATSSVFKS